MTDNITLPRAVVEQVRDVLLVWSRFALPADKAALAALDAALAGPEQKPEPVAWWHPERGFCWAASDAAEVLPTALPLYAAPPEPPAKPEPDAIARAVEAEREACAQYAAALAEAGWSAGSIANALRARESTFPTGASAAASGQDRSENSRAGHLMTEIRDALRRTDPAWCAVNGVEQISDEELDELIARVEDAVENGE